MLPVESNVRYASTPFANRSGAKCLAQLKKRAVLH
jgi:hypothetical protein